VRAEIGLQLENIIRSYNTTWWSRLHIQSDEWAYTTLEP